jgi:hypothetical protein
MKPLLVKYVPVASVTIAVGIVANSAEQTEYTGSQLDNWYRTGKDSRRCTSLQVGMHSGWEMTTVRMNLRMWRKGYRFRGYDVRMGFWMKSIVKRSRDLGDWS